MLKKKILSLILAVPIIGFTGLANFEMIESPMAKVEEQIVNIDSNGILNSRTIQTSTYFDSSEVEIEIVSEIVEEIEIIEEIEEVYYEPNYNPYNLLEPSNLTTEQVEIMLEGTNLQYLSRAYTYAEELYGISCLMLMSINIEESGWGTSSLTYSNNNLGGIKDSQGDWAYFESLGECVDYLANMLSNEYLSENGLFFNGYSIWNVNTLYCETSEWSDNINQIAYELLNKLNNK